MTYRRRSCACRPRQTRRGIGGNHPSCKQVLACSGCRCMYLHGVMYVHLVVEDLGFATLGRFDQMLIENLQDIFADLGKLCFDLLTVFLDQANLRLIAFRLLLLLDGCNNSPRCTSCSDNVLIGDREEIALFNRKFLVCRCYVLHALHHLCYIAY